MRRQRHVPLLVVERQGGGGQLLLQEQVSVRLHDVLLRLVFRLVENDEALEG